MPAIIYGPIALCALGLAARQPRPGWLGIAASFVAGWFAFSWLEYVLHRFVFHRSCGSAPNERIRFFLSHGYHHAYPRDRLRLVMPPLLTLPVAISVAALYGACLPVAVAAAAFAGTIAGYVAYDSAHWWLHHGRPRSAFGKAWKRYHLLHHHERTLARFSVTMPLWDRVFGTHTSVRRSEATPSA